MKKTLFTIVATVLVMVMGFCVYKILTPSSPSVLPDDISLSDNTTAAEPINLTMDDMVEDITETAEVSVDAAVSEDNSLVKGYLSISGQFDSLPFVTTPNDQNEYLRKDLNGNSDKNGTLFTAYDAVYGQSNVTTIFGHSMKDGAMFGKLKNYKNIDYLYSHQTISINNKNGQRTFQIVCVANVSTDYARNDWYYPKANYSEAEWENFVWNVKARSLFTSHDSLEYGKQYILLSTCDYEFNGERLIIVAKELPDEFTTVNYEKKGALKPAEFYTTYDKVAPTSDEIVSFIAQW